MDDCDSNGLWQRLEVNRETSIGELKMEEQHESSCRRYCRANKQSDEADKEPTYSTVRFIHIHLEHLRPVASMGYLVHAKSLSGLFRMGLASGGGNITPDQSDERRNAGEDRHIRRVFLLTKRLHAWLNKRRMSERGRGVNDGVRACASLFQDAC